MLPHLGADVTALFAAFAIGCALTAIPARGGDRWILVGAALGWSGIAVLAHFAK